MESSRAVTTLTLIGAALLIGIGGLHASGYPYVAESIAESQLSDFLKRVLPPLYLYPSVLMCVLASAAVTALWFVHALSFTMGLLALSSLANAVLGFVLGGLIPGVVMLAVTCIFALASRFAAAHYGAARERPVDFPR